MSHLKKHIRTVHELAGKHLFKCEHCEKSFKMEFTLKNHIKVIHEGIRVKCPVCQKPFVDKTVVKRHIENFHETKKLKFLMIALFFGLNGMIFTH